jgi:L-ascorbate metabolism protein UlaG (beta-lactamase superfamily)
MLRWISTGLVITVLALVSCSASGPRHEGPSAAPKDGQRFAAGDGLDKSFVDFLRWQFTREGGVPWTPRPARPSVPPGEVGDGELAITFINHATTLIQMAEHNVLTDPVWSERVGPVAWAGPRRYAPPGVDFGKLPRIDAVLISHNHFDHMDLPTLQRLADAHDPQFVVPLGNCHYLADTGIGRCTELDWWDSLAVGPELSLTAVPARHWSRRGAFDRNRALWAGYVLDGPKRVYFAGDTGFGPHFSEVTRRMGAPDVALMPIGAYLPAWFMSAQHISPAEAVSAHDALAAGETVGIHFGTFRLADDGQDQPVTDLAAALKATGTDPSRFWVPGNGDRRHWR